MSLRALKLINIAAAARLTATNAGTTGVDIRDYDGECRFVLNCSATEGAGQTCNTKLQHSPDNSTWTDVPNGAFTQVTNAAASHQVKGLNISDLQRYVRVVDTLAGGTPAVTRSVTLLAKKQYGG